MAKSSIEWTESTWNPVTGCTKIRRLQELLRRAHGEAIDYTVMVGADGAFRFDGLPDGSYVVVLRYPPQGWSMAAWSACAPARQV